MRSFWSNIPRLLFLAGWMIACGCATKPQNLFVASGAGWRTEQGQALWTPRRGAPQIGGDIVMVSDPRGRALVQFEKMPVTMVTAEITPDDWSINFPQGGGFWRGRQPAPTRTIWLFLPAALRGRPLPEPLQFSHEPNGNWRLENPKTGEILEGFVSP